MKRRFYGNQYSEKYSEKKAAEVVDVPDAVKKIRVVTEDASVKARKLKDVDVKKREGLDWSLCQQSTLYMEEDMLRESLASYLTVKCTNCSFIHSGYTSKGVENNKQLVEVDVKSVYVMRRIGVGHKGLQKFCGIMNMPPPVASKNYNKVADKLGKAAEKVAKVSMLAAAMEVKQTEGSEIGVSFDGTWQRRGHISLNGDGTAISVSTGKVIDCEPLSRL